MDTGSSELWTLKDCDSFPSGYADLCRNNSIYDPTLSSSSVHLDDKFQIKYLAASVSGSHYRDSVCFWGEAFSTRFPSAPSRMRLTISNRPTKTRILVFEISASASYHQPA